MVEQPRRVHFFHGMLLRADDLEVEQQYHQQMRHLHNRLHGFGVVSGLEVTVGRGTVRVEPGLAIDPCGREIVVTQPLTLRLERRRHGDPAEPWLRDLVITWQELPEAPVVVSSPHSHDSTEHTRWVEQPALSLTAAGEEAPESLLLARLSRTTRGSVQVDATARRSYGPPDTGSAPGATGS